MKKRDFIKLSTIAAAGTFLAPTLTFCGSGPSPAQDETNSDDEKAGGFELMALPYAFDALEPNIDSRTMEIHHGKHHKGYTDKLNKALEDHELRGKTIEEILAQLTPDEAHTALRNNGGGYYNHNLFWNIMSPSGGGAPTGPAGDAIQSKFGSYSTFQEVFTKAATGVFGSGWAWLCAKNGELFVTSTPNQDNPLMRHIAEDSGTPILGLDVWEHAYYLNYQNRRADYIQNFFNVVNWDDVNRRMAAV